MSSILEALRELEADRPPKTVPGVSVAHTPSEAARRPRGLVLTLAGGLAMGALVGAVYLWNAASSPADLTPPAAPRPAAGPAKRPAWLDGAEAPMARVTTPAPAADPAPTPPAAASVVPTPVAPTPRPVPADAARQAVPARDVRSLQVESVEYDVPAARRSVTLLLNGDRVTLREGESADGVSVQLITPEGAYLQRGSEVFLVTSRR